MYRYPGYPSPLQGRSIVLYTATRKHEKRYSNVAKLEVVCPDEDMHRVVKVIREHAYTGLHGDGIIFVSPVEMAVKIRSGAVGETGVQPTQSER